eukprot:TRINITY_DN14074_c0_g1_i1.p1 TRINITY_DN14074_c0_g1~~TRINITY_DN14074_c0_g1_i1.p1  ORF type:complete len:324 (-),score=25.24 TRINITY_DN14074_c0_g1_i1:25-996(-)
MKRVTAMCPVVLGLLLFPAMTSKLKLHGELEVLHIAKTAGTSLITDVPKLVTGKPFSGAEHCYGAARSQKLMTFVRDPRAHVYSQWMHCLYNKDSWFNPKHLPSNFTGWLQHWDLIGDKPQQAQAFHCYHPLNLQSRSLSCTNTQWSLPCATPAMDTYVLSDTKKQFVERFELAAQHLNEMYFVGITDFYQESLCALHVKEKNEFPEYCNCEDIKAWKAFPQTHATHGGPPHGPVETEVGKEDMELIRRLTLHDSKLYTIAMQRLRKDITEVEHTWNKRILCREMGDIRTKKTIALHSWDFKPDTFAESYEGGHQLSTHEGCK